MFWKKMQGPSIRKQLLLSLIGPLLLLSIVCAGLTYWLALQLSNEFYDELLANTSDSVVARIDYVAGKRIFDFPESAQTVFRHHDRDQFYYKVYTQDGHFLYGDSFLPNLPAMASGPHFGDAKIHGETVRMTSVFNQVPNQIEQPLVVTVAETCNARLVMAGNILLTIVLLQVLVIAGGTASLWIGINAGLAPLNNIREAMSKRSPTDLTPVTIEHAPREVVPMLEAINALLGELRIYITSQSRFVSDAAHQLRTPLAGIKTFVDLGTMQADDERSIRIFDQLKIGVARMTQMVNGLLSLARAEASTDQSRTEQVLDINVMTEAVVKSVSETWKHRSSTKISFHPSKESAVIKGAESSLRELVENLVQNAILYTPEGGDVSISIRTNGSVELIVEDNGPGIPPNEREKVFERFYRISDSSNKTGSGLGLAIVREIADKHAATITISDGISGKGCNFSVKFKPHQNGFHAG